MLYKEKCCTFRLTVCNKEKVLYLSAVSSRGDYDCLLAKEKKIIPTHRSQGILVFSWGYGLHFLQRTARG